MLVLQQHGRSSPCFKGFCYLLKRNEHLYTYLLKVSTFAYLLFKKIYDWMSAIILILNQLAFELIFQTSGLVVLKFFFWFPREKLNSMNLLMYMAPVAVIFLLVAALVMEEDVVGITISLARVDVKILWYLFFNSALAYFVNLTNFLVTKHTSALTLQVFLPIQMLGFSVLIDICSTCLTFILLCQFLPIKLPSNSLCSGVLLN